VLFTAVKNPRNKGRICASNEKEKPQVFKYFHSPLTYRHDMMRATSRQHIIEYIQSKEVVTALEISRALHMTPANARHHLSILRDEGVVHVLGQRARAGRGRPHDLYCLWRPISQHNLDGLAGALLAEIFAESNQDEQEGLLERLASRLLPAAPTESKNLTQRLTQAVLHLNRMSYQARWEAHAQGPRVILQHCPYAAIVAQHPEVCWMDQFLLRNLLSLPVQQLSKLEKTPSGFRQCVFKLG
jgi:predicted ArsR family transcriptional regulator